MNQTEGFQTSLKGPEGGEDEKAPGENGQHSTHCEHDCIICSSTTIHRQLCRLVGADDAHSDMYNDVDPQDQS